MAKGLQRAICRLGDHTNRIAGHLSSGVWRFHKFNVLHIVQLSGVYGMTNIVTIALPCTSEVSIDISSRLDIIYSTAIQATFRLSRIEYQLDI